MKILAVDDAHVVLLAIKRILQQQGHEVVTSFDGAEALSLLQRDPSIELVVTDLQMPSIDGVELCRRARNLRQQSEHGPIPAPLFILVSAGSTERDDYTEWLQRDESPPLFEAVLDKPFSKAELLGAVAAVEAKLSACPK